MDYVDANGSTRRLRGPGGQESGDLLRLLADPDWPGWSYSRRIAAAARDLISPADRSISNRVSMELRVVLFYYDTILEIFENLGAGSGLSAGQIPPRRVVALLADFNDPQAVALRQLVTRALTTP